MKKYQFRKVKEQHGVTSPYERYRCTVNNTKRQGFCEDDIYYKRLIPASKTAVVFELWKEKKEKSVDHYDANHNIVSVPITGFLCKIYAYPTAERENSMYYKQKLILADTYEDALKLAKKAALSWLRDVIRQIHFEMLHICENINNDLDTD